MNAALVLCAASATLFADRSYFVMVFAHQDAPDGRRPSLRSIHSFAHWVAVDGREISEEFTISWVAARGMRVWAGPQAGRNQSLGEAMDEAQRRGWRVTMWGPYGVAPEAFAAARKQFERLEAAERTGRVKYKLLDRQTRGSEKRPAFHCVHALTDIAGERVVTGAAAGVAASELIVQAYARRGWIVPSDSAAEWIWESVRPTEYAVARRGATPLRTTAARGRLAEIDDEGEAQAGAAVILDRPAAGGMDQDD